MSRVKGGTVTHRSTIIVDCSGSMGGDSIAQARKALYEILELLRPEDAFNVIRFGSSHEKLFPSPVRADDGNLKKQSCNSLFP